MYGSRTNLIGCLRVPGEVPSVVADDEDGLELSHLLMAWGHLAFGISRVGGMKNKENTAKI